MFPRVALRMFDNAYLATLVIIVLLLKNEVFYSISDPMDIMVYATLTKPITEEIVTLVGNRTAV